MNPAGGMLLAKKCYSSSDLVHLGASRASPGEAVARVEARQERGKGGRRD